MYVVTTLLADWARQGPAIARWAAVRPPAAASLLPIEQVVFDGATLDVDVRARTIQAINRCFTPDEAQAVSQWLARADLGSSMSLHCEPIFTPITADDLLALQNPNPFSAQTLWRLRPAALPGPGASVTVEGIVSLWPWGTLTPAEGMRLVANRDRSRHFSSTEGARESSPAEQDSGIVPAEHSWHA